MQQLKGKAIGKGITEGRIFVYENASQPVRRLPVKDADAELSRLETALAKAEEELRLLHERAFHEAGEEAAAIFEAQRIMLRDEEFGTVMTEIIRSEKVCAEYAAYAAAEHFKQLFSELEDGYFGARSADISDISQRLVRCLNGSGELSVLSEPVILAAEELTPSETLRFDRSLLLGFVTHLGSVNSHAAILARQMSLPAISGIEIDRSWNGRYAVLDAHEGVLTIDADESVQKKIVALRRQDEERRERLERLVGKESVTKSGRRIRISANIDGLSDCDSVLEQDAEAVGLFRSEALYLEEGELPSEEKQFEAYRAVAEKMDGRSVVIRTLDLGADKQAAYLPLEPEENPALGYRAIRICLDRPDIFRTQLRAILRASVFGDLSILFPMIISTEELRSCRKHVEEVCGELRSENIPFREDIRIGIMIETPAAALISGELAKEADFFSIGTNDLLQYTLAVDRQNSRLDAIADPHHPALLELIRLTIENAHKNGIKAGICGELAADASLTQTFLDYGVDELSVSPGSVLELREAVRNSD
ncbi:MAG: phosphoenolpyruvate--protein phosphotransferase [Lachnospiraceae bacterium]|nr:phosphoenolpyruvate--protein phosphotransferase [Lachnospiraceae bacterium]